jgi:hypothetical protein
MGAGKPRVLAGWVLAAVGLTVMAGACSHASSPTPATPTVSPSTVPVLGKLSFGTFPSTYDGIRALQLCEQWSGLRGEYVVHLRQDTPYELEQWFSSTVWLPAFTANSPLRDDPAYSNISTAFGLATTAEAASISSAKWLDRGCAAAD